MAISTETGAGVSLNTWDTPTGRFYYPTARNGFKKVGEGWRKKRLKIA